MSERVWRTAAKWWSRDWRDVDRIFREQLSLKRLSEHELTARARSIGWRLRSGVTPTRLIVPAFALVAEAVARTLSINLFPVQLYAGLRLCRGLVVEMQTGEGKTITAVAPVCLRAFSGNGCHVMTANEYLAQRDAERLRPAYELLGLSVSSITSATQPGDRKSAYACDVTYGTASEFGFDYLRDRLSQSEWSGDQAAGKSAIERLPGLLQRGHHFALIDEADSILLDEARTPLIIALPTPPDAGMRELLEWSQQTARSLSADRDYELSSETRGAQLTDAGCRRVLLAPRAERVGRFDLETLYSRVEIALQADRAYQRDRDYMVRENGLQIVDESTGRSLNGRRWQRGLHQAIEFNENLPLSDEQGVAASVTLQRYLRLYPFLAGMTGTAWTARGEFRRLYRLRVSRVPTHRPPRRIAWPPRVFSSNSAKWNAVCLVVADVRAQGRPVLIGTPSIRASEELSARLTERNIPHRVLNARQDAEEAEIVAAAGHAGCVTIATNMAGRGTDIELSDSARAAGGLHVIATEFHTSRRIDRQLIGRAARQGDAGSYQFMVSLDDELFDHISAGRVQAWRRSASRSRHKELPGRQWLGIFRKVQREVERRHARDRRKLLKAERKRSRLIREMGLDPVLDLLDEP